jgi:hypothetical protein
MTIERRDDEMQTNGGLVSPLAATPILMGEGTNTMSSEIEFRMRRLEAEADRERLTPRREGLRWHRAARRNVGHGLMALGRMIHGIEVEHSSRPALHTR